MPKEYFKKLADLLEIERKADLLEYQNLIEKTSIVEKRALGVSWYPVAIKSNEMGRGDYLSITLERTTHHDVIHQFKFGASVVFFSNHDPLLDKVEGVITHQSVNTMNITIRFDELPNWCKNGKLGVSLLFDENSYDEMQNALKLAAKHAENEVENKLIYILTAEKKPSFKPDDYFILPDYLNFSQLSAVHKILSANDLAIIHGPPGTGKTTTLVAAIQALIKHGEDKILVTAPSNTAVDLLTERLAEVGLSVIRAGNPARVSAHLQAATLDFKVINHPDYKQIKALRKQSAAYKNMAHKYKRTFGRAEQEQRKALFDEARKIDQEIDKITQYITESSLNRAEVITATLVGAQHHAIKSLQYKTVVIDEAGQALEPACWIPILKGKKLILAGDHCQLPPTIKSHEAAQKGLNTTLLEKCILLHPEAVTLLQEQYRMHEHIMGYSAAVFYHNRLVAHTSVAKHTVLPLDKPLMFIDTAGCSFDEQLIGTSSTNPDEANFLINHLANFIQFMNSQNVNQFPSIAVISPYKQQVQILQQLFAANDDLLSYQAHITINTIDSFQGQERDVVYISLTRSNEKAEIGFLADIRRMNVAMTRAKKKLVVIGDSATLSKSKFYADFISYAAKLDAYHSAYEFINI